MAPSGRGTFARSRLPTSDGSGPRGRERHAVDVAAQGGGRRVHVAVRVNPEQANRQLLRSPRPMRGRRHRPGGEAVVAAEHKRQGAVIQTPARRLVQLLTDLRDVVDILLPLVLPLPRSGMAPKIARSTV